MTKGILRNYVTVLQLVLDYVIKLLISNRNMKSFLPSMC